MLLLLKFLSWRYWSRHAGGFALAALGVSLGIAVFVAIQVANYSVLRAFDASLDAVTGRANLQIEGGANGLRESVFVKLAARNDPRIEAAAPVLSRTLFSPTLGRSLLVQGVDPFSEVAFRDYEPHSAAPKSAAARATNQPADNAGSTRGVGATGEAGGGRGLVPLLTDARAIAISESLARRAKLGVGSALELFSGARRLKFHVAAVLEGAQTGQAFGGDFAVLDIAAAQEAFGFVGRISGIDLRVDESALPQVRASLRPLLPGDARVTRPAQRGGEVAGLLQAFQLNLSALSCIAVFVGAFLIYNAIAMAVVRRRHEAGILRATGASGGTLARMFVAEAAGIGAAGGVLGLFLGLLMARLALKAVATTVTQLYIAVRASELFVPAWLWWGAPLGGTVLAMLAAIPAARGAGRVSPREAISRSAPHQASGRVALPLAGGGVLMLGLAGALCLPVVTARSVFAGFVAAFCTLAGFAMLCPLATLGVGGAVQRVGAATGVETLLAGQYLRRAIGRSGLAVAALSVALAMSIGVSLMVRSFRDTVADWVNATITADLYVTVANGFGSEAGQGLPREVVKFVKKLPGVRVADTIRGATLTLHNQPVFIGANEMPALQTGDRPLRLLSTAHGVQNARQQFLQGRALLVSERFKNLVGPGAGDRVVLPTPRGPHSFFIAGVFADYTPDQCVLYMPKPLYVRWWSDRAVDGVGLYLDKTTSALAARDAIERHFRGRYTLTLVPNADLRREVFKTFDQTFAVTYALQLIAVIVAGIGVFDTLLALLLERGRELATLRAVGASSSQVVRSTLKEFALIGALAWLIGVASGAVLAAQLIFVINRQFFGWSIAPSVPLAPLEAALALAIGAALAAGGWPALRAARRPLAESLQED